MYDFNKTELDVLKFWHENKVYEKLKAKNIKGKPFYFLQGPPYTSGKIHIGTAWNNCLKDTALRYKRMKGFDVWDRGGYDMHGLPTENAVQKMLKLGDKKEIEKYGVEKFIQECKKFSVTNMIQMNKDMDRLGVWLDNEHAYQPITNEFMEGEWFLIKKAWEQKRLYKGKKIMHWCASCETSLAKHELEYENVKDKSIFLKFKLGGKKNEYLIIWTTTPWTIPYNLAVMVNPELEYVKVRVEDGKEKGETWILAKALANVVMTSVFEKKFKIIDELKGDKLEGLEYEHPFHSELKKVYDDLKKKHKNVHTVVLSEEYVTTDAGSGLVHCAPGCGPEDFEVGHEYDLPAFNTLDEKGNLLEFDLGLGKLTAKKDDDKIIEMLKKKGSLLAITDVEHEYPFCWRCHNAVVFRATEQWFLKTEDMIPEMLKANEKVKWVPAWGRNAFDSWVKALKDNSITRQRYWGTPVPIWECPKCKSIEVIGSQQELKKKAMNKVPVDLHKPWIDGVKLKCKCNSEMSRVPDVIDVWIDAGTASWNCLYYPGREDYFNKLFPADFILEANEQVRLWFSMLLTCSMVAFKRHCYKSVYMHGMILDWQGMKMSKSLGNIVSPYEIIEKYGVDIFRYYMTESQAGENINFSWEGIKIKQRNINILWNLKNYLVELAKLIGKNPGQIKPQLGLEESYILSRCNSTIKQVTELFEEYRLDETILGIESLFLDLSRIYIQLIRDKASVGSDKDKETVLYTIHHVLMNAIKLFAPICPFMTDAIYQELRKMFKLKEESVHMCQWPVADEKMINKNLEQELSTGLAIIEKALAARSEAGIGIRWPLNLLTVKTDKKISKEIEAIILRQVNVKKLKVHEGKQLEVTLDTKMTAELEAEGYVREIMRSVQDKRKKAGLTKDQKIGLEIAMDRKLQEYARKNAKIIGEKVGAKTVILSDKISKKYKHVFDDKVKDKNLTIAFDILQ